MLEKKKIKNIVICLFVIILICIWSIRYYSFNNGFGVSYYYDRQYFDMGEVVDYDDDKPVYNQSCKGYSIQVNDVGIFEPNEYAELNSQNQDFSISGMPDKIVEIDVTFHNSNNETDGIQFYPIQLVGMDWFMTIDPKLVAFVNPIYENDSKQAYGIILRPDSSYDIKLVYGIYKVYFPEERWSNFQNEEMWLEITIMPTNKLIKLF